MQISKLIPAICVAAFCTGQFAARADDNPAQAAARAALMEKMNQLEVEPAQPAPPPPIVVTPSGAAWAQTGPRTNAVTVTPPAVSKQPMAPAPQTKPAPVTGKAPTAPAPAASPAPPVQPAATNPAKPVPSAFFTQVVMPANPINPNSPGTELGLKPIVAPPLPISAAKEAQLQGLLERYKTDQITPEQYHTARAKILAGP